MDEENEYFEFIKRLFNSLRAVNNFDILNDNYFSFVTKFYLKLLDIYPELPPYFFSGNSKERKLIFILTNPMLDTELDINETITKFKCFKDIDEFLNDQYCTLVEFKRRSPFYVQCDEFTKEFISQIICKIYIGQINLKMGIRKIERQIYKIFMINDIFGNLNDNIQ